MKGMFPVERPADPWYHFAAASQRSGERVAEHGEMNAMPDPVKPETERIDSRFPDMILIPIQIATICRRLFRPAAFSLRSTMRCIASLCSA